MGVLGYLVPVDLGQVNDHTALSVIELNLDYDEDWERVVYFDVRHLQRYPLRTDYPSIVRDVRNLLHRPRWTHTRPR